MDYKVCHYSGFKEFSTGWLLILIFGFITIKLLYKSKYYHSKFNKGCSNSTNVHFPPDL